MYPTSPDPSDWTGFIPFDELDHPTEWNFLSLAAPQVRLDAGATLEFTTSQFAGTSSTAYFQVAEFEDCQGCARAIDWSTDEGKRQGLQLRTEAEGLREPQP